MLFIRRVLSDTKVYKRKRYPTNGYLIKYSSPKTKKKCLILRSSSDNFEEKRRKMP